MKFSKFFLVIGFLLLGFICYKLFVMYQMMNFKPPQMPPMPVQVYEAKQIKIRNFKDFSGKLEAVEKAEIRPQISGKVEKILFKEGDFVEKGEKLFNINSSLYNSQLSQAQASYNLAFNDFQRAEKLLKIGGVSKKEYEEKLSAKNQAFANLTNAKLNKEYSDVVAPISGKVGRAEIVVGNLVDPMANQILTNIINDKKLYAEFDIDENNYLEFINKNRKKKKIKVRIFTDSNKTKGYRGYITSFDNQINDLTGTIRARAVLRNKSRNLLSGQYVKVRLLSPVKEKVIVIPEGAVGTDQNKKFVFIVDKNNKVEYRPVEVGQALENGLKIINSGLKKGEKIITSSTLMLRPGAEVKPSN
ncbi:MAG: efflux RND transporter periplasmic adaptor subunit [Rickettsiales bacterium]|nr:efflux RND transporter periplasmic adaptor subunit [Rickettsiales bacterium]